MSGTIYIEHYVNDMDESMVQNCIFCGKTISDYRGCEWPNDQPAPKGFAAGSVFKGGGMTMSGSAFDPEKFKSIKCTKTI